MPHDVRPPPPDDPPCQCKTTRHTPRPPTYSTGTWQVTSACPIHYHRLSLTVRVRILLNEDRQRT